MSQRWRFLPDRSQLLLLGGVLVVLYAGVSFINLALAKGAAVAEQQVAAARLQALQEQNSRLRDALAQAQRGEHIEPRARQYFNWVQKGEKKVVLQPVPGSAAGNPASQPGASAPYWQAWWQLLTQN